MFTFTSTTPWHLAIQYEPVLGGSPAITGGILGPKIAPSCPTLKGTTSIYMRYARHLRVCNVEHDRYVSGPCFQPTKTGHFGLARWNVAI